MIVTIASIVVIFLETFLYKIFLDIFFDKPEKKRLYICLTAAFICSMLCAVFLSDKYILKIAFIILAYTIIWKICYKSPWYKNLLSAVTYSAMQLLSDYAVMIVFYQFFPEVVSNTITNDIVGSIASLISKILIFIIILILRQVIGRNKRKINNQGFKVFIFPVVTLILMVVIICNWSMIENRSQAVVLTAVILAIMIMNLIMFIWFDVDSKTSGYDERLKTESDRQRAAIHEFKNLLAVIYQLAEEDDTEGLQSLIKDNRKWLSEKVDRITTGNPIIDVIINGKIDEMEKLGIAHMITISEIDELPINETDFIILVSNILNNAIEAAQKCDEPLISIRCSEDEHNFIFYVENTMSEAPLIENGNFISSKEDKENHGKGIANIINIVEKYNGEYDIDIADATFGFSTMFYINGK